MFAQLIVSGLVMGCIYAMVALGMTVLLRSTTIVNFCHGEFFMLGAFIAVIALSSMGVPYLLALLLAIVIITLLGCSIEKLLLRPLSNAPHISLAMMTIALSYLFKGIVRFSHGRSFMRFPPLIEGDPIMIGNIVFMPQDLITVIVALLIVVLFFVFFQKTTLGKIVQASSQTPRGAMLVGINVSKIQNLMWGTGAALGAIAGILIAPATLVYPDMGSGILVASFAAMTLGGFGSLLGAVVGAITLGVLQNLLGGYISSSLVDITAYLAIILVLLFRPQGIMGEWSLGRA